MHLSLRLQTVVQYLYRTPTYPTLPVQYKTVPGIQGGSVRAEYWCHPAPESLAQTFIILALLLITPLPLLLLLVLPIFILTLSCPLLPPLSLSPSPLLQYCIKPGYGQEQFGQPSFPFLGRAG